MSYKLGMSVSPYNIATFTIITIITHLEKLSVIQYFSSVNLYHRKMMNLPKISEVQNDDHKPLENSELS